MQDTVKKGDIAVTTDGDVVIITRINIRGDALDNSGRVHTFHHGTVLRSDTLPVGSRYAGKYLRVVLHSTGLVRLAETSGYDLLTPAEIPDEELSEVQILRRKVQELQDALKTASLETERRLPRTPIAPLQVQK